MDHCRPSTDQKKVIGIGSTQYQVCIPLFSPFFLTFFRFIIVMSLYKLYWILLMPSNYFLFNYRLQLLLLIFLLGFGLQNASLVFVKRVSMVTFILCSYVLYVKNCIKNVLAHVSCVPIVIMV